MEFKVGDKVRILYTIEEKECPRPKPGTHIKKKYIGVIMAKKNISAQGEQVYIVQFPRESNSPKSIEQFHYQNLPENNLILVNGADLDKQLAHIDKLILAKEIVL